ELSEAGSDEWVLQQWGAVCAGDARRIPLGLGEVTFEGAHRTDPGPLVPQEELRVVPAPVLLTDEVVRRDPHVGEEDLVDLVAAVDELDGAHLDAGAVPVDEQERDALLLLGTGRAGTGPSPHEAEEPVGMLSERHPGLLTVDDILIAITDRGGAQGRQVGPGVGLGEALTPPDVEVG